MFTDRFLATKLGKITDTVGGALEGGVLYTGLYLAGAKIVSKLVGFEIDPFQTENIMATGTAALLSVGFGLRHLRPIESVNNALKAVNIIKNEQH